MSGRAVNPALSLGASPGQQTLDTLHNRLVSAEEDARQLSQQLATMSFSQQNPKDLKTVRFTDNPSKSKKIGNGHGEPIAPFKARVPDIDVSHQNYDDMVARVCRMESTIQTLKLNITQAQAERDLSKKEKIAANEKMSSLSEDHDTELKKMNRDLLQSQKECKNALDARKEAEETVQRLQKALEEATNSQSTYSFELEDLRSCKTKQQRRITELRDELGRETSLRVSLEESHNTLLSRIRDMETIVEKERADVQSMSANCMHLKYECEQARNETQHELQLRKSIESQLLTMQAEQDCRQRKISSLEEDKRLLMDEIRKLHKQYTDLNNQIDNMQQLELDKQCTYKQLEHENKQLYEAMKSSATQNAQLISKYEQELESGLVEKADMIKLEDQIKQLEEQLHTKSSEKSQSEKKCVELEKRIESLKNDLSHQQSALEKTAEGMDKELVSLQQKMAALGLENQQLLHDKASMLDEVNQAVDSMSEERKQLESQLQEAQLELQGVAENRKQLVDENGRLLQRLAALDDHQASQKKLEHSLAEMLEQKNKLAYDKGRLQSKVEQLQSDLESLAHAQTDLTQARRVNSGLENKVSQLQSELSGARMSIQRMESQLKQSHSSGDRKEKDFDLAIKARDEAVTEAQKLLQHIEALEDKHRQKGTAFQHSLTDVREDNRKMAATLETVMQSYSQLQNTVETLQIELGHKDNTITQLKDEKMNFGDRCGRLQREVDQLQDKLLTTDNVEVSQIPPLRSALQQCKEDNKKLAQNMESLIHSNKQLQATADNLTDKLHQQTHIVDRLKESREKDEDKHKQEVHVLEERLENLKQQLLKEREKISKKNTKDIADVRKQLETALSKNGDLSRTNTELRHKVTEVEYQLKEQKDKILSYKSQADHLQRIRTKQEQTIEALSGFGEQLSDLEKAKNDYMRKTKEQAKTIQTLMSQITELQKEIQTLAKSHLDTTTIVQKQEEELSREKRLADQLRQKYKEAKKREERLESLRQQTENKLLEANNESLQISSNLQDAHQWFKSKFDHLQGELLHAKRSKADLESEKKESYHILNEEKRQAQDAAERAQLMIKSSREMISKLADHAEYSQHDTLQQMLTLKQQLEEEKYKAEVAEKKLRDFQESSFRHTEDLAKELDYLKSHSWILNDS